MSKDNSPSIERAGGGGTRFSLKVSKSHAALSNARPSKRYVDNSSPQYDMYTNP